MKNHGNSKGFTLVEIIVVLLILAILAAVAIPTMLGYIKRSERAICESELGSVRRLYLLKSAGEGYVVSDAQPLLKAVVEEFGGTVTSETTYDAQCGGICTVKFSDDKSVILSISCSKHGDGEVNPYAVGSRVGIDRAKHGLATLVEEENVAQIVFGYIATHPTSKSLDSAGLNFAPQVNALLTELGYSTDEIGWRIYYTPDRNTYDMYWTDCDVSKCQVGEKVRYLRCVYDKETNAMVGEYTTGMVSVVWNNSKQEFKVLKPNEKDIVPDEVYGASWEE